MQKETKMSNKIVFIQGSPLKNGNTRAVATIAMNAALGQNAEVVEIDATKLKFKKPGCTGCLTCQVSEEYACIIDDQLSQSVATFSQYDVIVMATPLYWFSFPAQIKMVIDRMFSLIKFVGPNDFHSPLTGKTFALIATSGDALENNLNFLDLQWKNSAAFLGCSYLSCLFPNISVKAGELKKDPSAVKKAQQFGRLLAEVN
jgi:multimeric flavodoxin WrbA